MHPVHLIARSLERGGPYRPLPLPEEPVTGICCITGEEEPTIPRAHLLGPSFMDGAVLAAPGSVRVSAAAWNAFTAQEDRGKKRGFTPERNASWICDGESFRVLDRQGMRAAVLGEPQPRPWVAYATTSYKKHGSLRAPINSGSRRVWLFESRRVDCSDFSRVWDMWDRLNEALRLRFGRSILESLDCPPYVMRKCGLREWMAFERWARPLRATALYAFLCYLLPSQEELRGESA